MLIKKTMKQLNVLIACEFSGTVRDAFTKLGHIAVSCDLEPTDAPGLHHQGSVLDILDKNPFNGQPWDLMIAHPPCTYLTLAGNRWFKPEYKERYPTREQDRKDGADFFMALMDADIPHISVENPIGVMSSIYRKT